MALVLVGVGRRFPGGGGIEGITLEASPGEILVLVGPSGCGKTTLLRVIAGLERADSGTVSLDDRDLGALPPEARGLGYVFQNHALFPGMSVADNVAFGLRARRVPRAGIPGRVREALELVGLPDAGRREPAELSGGEQQRVALARALVTRPGALLLDEPFSNLDPALRRSLRTHLRRLRADTRIPMVHVTHDREEALALADRLAVLDQGRLVQAGSPRELFTAPATGFVARFLTGADPVPAVRTPEGISVLGRPLVPAMPLPEGPLLAAIRPDAVRPGPPGRWRGRVVDREFLGTHVELVLEVDGVRLRARVETGSSGADASFGEILSFELDPGRLRFVPAGGGGPA
jgi:iron(III) transport system ATP-binding protein